ncbi:hypothetical protein [Falcatimonas sp. MSJ-15]|uniref:hypothetical protein n=1 Tax=Falcatimonas sp. MSJ-15 TaxID=2841515 RepID=UPI0020A04A59|nr:hypothetical protein [Falcatimonas sp. MSJ-15]
MANCTSNTYTLKRKILTFSNKISRRLSKPERKFTADIIYGMLAAGSCLLTDVVDQLHKNSKKINIVDRLSRHLDKGTPAEVAASYLQQVKKWVPAEPVIHIDDSDVVKPDGYKFESLGIVRDGSESTSTKIDKKIVLPKSGSDGAYFSASNQQTVHLFLSKKRQIGILGRFIYFIITFCGNSRKVCLHPPRTITYGRHSFLARECASIARRAFVS